MMLQFHNFAKAYGVQPVLQIEKLALPSGIHWIQGDNGTGKSTLLKALAGLIHFKGTVLLDGDIDLKKQPLAYRKRVNFAESEAAFPLFLNGQDMIKLFMKAKNATQEQLWALINGFGMSDYLTQPLSSYSAGMLKKLSLVLAFLGKPSLLLLDEPFITLDQQAIEQLAHWIKERHEQQQINFILTSHQAIPSNVPIDYTFKLINQGLTPLNSAYGIR
ncbi:ABC transporter ATP-binding protein [Olivibacter ginsenosidimutans]|uniref:ABC transporter ATP-binding protein n=1 Tax=Olivibacter ginsenosidimutans TaxID=1176537 RepID=A0ABP9B9Q6_9SPHI